MSVQLSNAAVTINNNVIAIIPNSLAFTEGLGEQVIRTASAGGGAVDQVFSENIETNLSMIKFDIPATIENIELAREWKVNKNQNLVQIAGRTPEGTLTRSFSQAALINDYEVALGSDTNIPIEFRANQAV